MKKDHGTGSVLPFTLSPVLSSGPASADGNQAFEGPPRGQASRVTQMPLPRLGRRGGEPLGLWAAGRERQLYVPAAGAAQGNPPPLRAAVEALTHAVAT